MNLTPMSPALRSLSEESLWLGAAESWGTCYIRLTTQFSVTRDLVWDTEQFEDKTCIGESIPH